MPVPLIETVIGTYKLEENAEGLATFIKETLDSLPKTERDIYVRNKKGKLAYKATFIRQTLTDGTTWVDLYLDFDT